MSLEMTVREKMERKLRPCGDRVLVKLKPPEQKGLIIQTRTTVEQEKYATQEATIVWIGKGAWKQCGDGSPWAEVGDKVLICKYSGEDREDIEPGEVYRMISDENVYGVFEGE